MVPYDAKNFNPYANMHSDFFKIQQDEVKSENSEHISVEASDDSTDRPDTEEQPKEKKKNPYSIEELLKKPDKMTNVNPIGFPNFLRQPSGSMIDIQTHDKDSSNRSSPASYCSTRSVSNDCYLESTSPELKDKQ